MIVFIIGGHGSGKTTLVRSVMKNMRPIEHKDRKYPLGYVDDKKFVVGHYEIKNGGADTVRPLDFLKKTIETYARQGKHVIVDGIGQAGIDKYVGPLIVKHGGAVLHLTTSVEDCAKGIKARGHKLSLPGVQRGHARAAGLARRLAVMGCNVLPVTRTMAPRKLKELLR